MQKEFLESVKEGNLERVKFFIEHGANIEVGDIDRNTPLLWATSGNYFEIVKFLVEKGADIEAKNIYGYNPFFCAVERGHLEIFKFFIETGKIHMETKNCHGDSPLILATKSNKMEIIKYLLEIGADTEVKNWKVITFLEYVYSCDMEEILDLINLYSSYRIKPAKRD